MLGLFPEKTQHNRYIFVNMHRYSKLTRATPTLLTTSTHVANLFFDQYLVLHGIPTYLRTDNSVQLTRNLLQRYASCLLSSISAICRIIYKLTAKLRDTTRRSVLTFDTTSRNTKEILVEHLLKTASIYIYNTPKTTFVPVKPRAVLS